MNRFLIMLVLTFSLIEAGGGAMNQNKGDGKEKAGGSPRGITRSAFGKTKEGAAVDIYAITNGKGMTARITNFGAIVTQLDVPDRGGKQGDVILGFENLDSYLATHPYFGAIVGRVGNRIARGKFKLNGVEYKLATNNGPNHLHGGLKGFDKAIWKAEAIPEGPSLRLTYVSKDGEEGYPGTLTSIVTYTVTSQNELKIEYRATTDKATPVNLTNHMYFNLAGPGTADVLAHEVTIFADRYTPVDDGLIPTGELASVIGTPMDFTRPATIGSRIAQVNGGYDHNYVLNSGGSKSPALAVRVHEPKTGRVMEVLTTQPGVQFYTGNFLDGSLTGIGGVYRKQYGFCLETQHFPDSVNHPKFPSTILEPGQTYHEVTIYRFSIK